MYSTSTVFITFVCVPDVYMHVYIYIVIRFIHKLYIFPTHLFTYLRTCMCRTFSDKKTR